MTKMQQYKERLQELNKEFGATIFIEDVFMNHDGALMTISIDKGESEEFTQISGEGYEVE